jgi:hypothetical protein
MSILETIEGRGRVSRGSDVLLRDVSYSITYYQREIDDRRGGSIPGIRRMEARIDVDPFKATEWVISSEVLTLTLADGRTMNFRMRNQEGDVVRANGGDL